jgi:quercetin dioxygenase-like cupin family protein
MSDLVRHGGAPFRWAGVPVLAYKEEGTHFRDVTRQVLFEPSGTGAGALDVQLRYFEVAPGGHTTLERHAHEHLVVVLRGPARCLVGERLHDLEVNDVVHVPADTWHQFRTGDEGPLGFLCLVRAERDRPRRPTPEELRALREEPALAAFIRV